MSARTFGVLELQSIPPPRPDLAHLKCYFLGECSVFVGVEPHQERGLVRMRWHLSIAHKSRYPTWDEIKEARYRLVPDEVTMAMILPPSDGYVNLHNNCFHLYEIDGADK